MIELFNAPEAYEPKHAARTADWPVLPGQPAPRHAREYVAQHYLTATATGPCADTSRCNRAGEPYDPPRELAESELWHTPRS